MWSGASERADLDRHIRWNDMAVITHDNAAVRLFGERLRRDGVPVRYSSVTRSFEGRDFRAGIVRACGACPIACRGDGGMPDDVGFLRGIYRT